MSLDQFAMFDADSSFSEREKKASDFYALLIAHLTRNHVVLTESEKAVFSDVLTRLQAAQEEGSLCVTVSETDRDVLLKTGLASDLDVGETLLETKPYVLETDEESVTRLYTQRDYVSEVQLAKYVTALAATPARVTETAYKTLELLYKGKGQRHNLNDDQYRAVRATLERNFSIICGGPGTGKTTTVAAILECLMSDNPTLKILLAAPTGKAASHLKQSITESALSDARYVSLSLMVKTISWATLHRFLSEKLSNGERPSEKNPLQADVIVIDESSMIAIDLAKRLFTALKPTTRVIMLGDVYQLRAVGPGSVFGDLTSFRRGFFTSVLTQSHRFSAQSALGKLSEGIKGASETKRGEFAKKLLHLLTVDDSSCTFEDAFSDTALAKGKLLTDEAYGWIKKRANRHAQAIMDYMASGRTGADKRGLWAAVMQDTALATVREGVMGLEVINKETERAIRATVTQSYPKISPEAGRLIIIRQNSSEMNLFNGDIGIVLPEPGLLGGRQKVYFGDILGEDDAALEVRLGLLPHYETAFAITIHQSQGSEYREVAVFLPMNPRHRLAVNELLYTAVTRVKASKEKPGKLTFFGHRETFETCLTTSRERQSGLVSKLNSAETN